MVQGPWALGLRAGPTIRLLSGRRGAVPNNTLDGYTAFSDQQFEEVVFALRPGDVSDVFKTRFGLHIVKVLDYVPAKPREFEEVKEEVRQHLFDQAENACIDQYTADLKARASIVRES